MIWRAVPVLLLLLSSCSTIEPGSSPRRDRGRSLLEQYRNLPVPAGNVRITIERHEVVDRDAAHVRTAMRYRGPRVTVAAGHPPVGIWHTRDGFSAAISGGRQNRGYRSSSRKFLMLQPGTEASLELLESRPQPWTVVLPVYDGLAVVETFREEITGTGFYVTVHRAGANGVDVELTPWFHSKRHRGVLKVEELTTRVTLQPGVPAVIMADESSQHDVTRQLLSYASRNKQSELVVVMTAEVGSD